MDWKAYKEGWEAWEKYYASEFKVKTTNPYKQDTAKFYSWNRGWNYNQKGIK